MHNIFVPDFTILESHRTLRKLYDFDYLYSVHSIYLRIVRMPYAGFYGTWFYGLYST